MGPMGVLGCSFCPSISRFRHHSESILSIFFGGHVILQDAEAVTKVHVDYCVCRPHAGARPMNVCMQTSASVAFGKPHTEIFYACC